MSPVRHMSATPIGRSSLFAGILTVGVGIIGRVMLSHIHEHSTTLFYGYFSLSLSLSPGAYLYISCRYILCFQFSSLILVVYSRQICFCLAVSLHPRPV